MPIEGRIVGGKEVAAKITEFFPAAYPYLKDALSQMQYRLQRIIQEEFLSGSPLAVRSGTLRERTAVRPIEETGTSMRGPVGNDTIYAPAQNYGAQIVPKNVSFLTIPLQAAMTAVGVMKWSARQIIESPGEGGYEGTFFAKGVLFGKLAGGGIEALFALKESVKLPPRPFMEPAVERVSEDYVTALTDALEKAKQAVGLG